MAQVKRVNVSRYDVICAPSLGDESAVLIGTGITWIYRLGGHGGLRVLGLRYSGEAILSHEIKTGIGVQALTSCDIVRYPGRSFEDQFNTDARVLLRTIERQSRIAHEWVARSGLDAAGRIAHLFCETVRRSGQILGSDKPFDVPFTQSEIAAITSLTSVHVNRVLRDLARRHIISRSGNQIVADWRALERVGQFQPNYLD